MKEQQLKTQTFVKLDFIDCLKLMFGKVLTVELKIFVPQEQEINNFNCFTDVKFDNTLKYFTKQNKPKFGYVAKFDEIDSLIKK